MLSRKSINVALIGQAFMGRAHSNAWGQVGKFFKLPVKPVLHTAVARNARSLKAFAANWGWLNHSTDWKKVVRSKEIDLVDIGTPNYTHAQMAIAALRGGKHVACEKPLAGTLADARIYPAIDLNASGTRREERLHTPKATEQIALLRRSLSDMPPKDAMSVLLERIGKYKTNAELLQNVPAR